jgi:hypothetical protein
MRSSGKPTHEKMTYFPWPIKMASECGI